MDGQSEMVSSSNANQSFLARSAVSTASSWVASTDSAPGASRSISSRQPHAPLIASPRSTAAEASEVSSAEQLSTTSHRPRHVPSSRTVSVLPAPAAPAHAPPIARLSACVSVTKQRSLSGVSTSRSPTPLYSYPWPKLASATATLQAPSSHE